MEALDGRQWPRTEAEIHLLRSAMFTAQAMARDMAAAGRGDEIEEIARNISKIAPELPPDSAMTRMRAGNPTASRRRFVSRYRHSPRTVPPETPVNPDHWTEVGELLASLYRIVERLEVLFPGRKFTPTDTWWAASAR